VPAHHIRTLIAVLGIATLALKERPGEAAESPHELAIDSTAWRVIERESGPVDYYSVVRDPPIAFIRGRYHPPDETTVIGFQVPEADRRRVRAVHWKWRAVTLPRGGNECDEHKQDSAAVVYLTWKRGLRWYTIKYVWSSVGPKGAICDRRRSLFSAQDTVIVESGGPLDAWRAVDVDLAAEFRAHFEGGRADADVPPFVGIGLMTDGDQTRSEAAADYAEFVLSW